MSVFLFSALACLLLCISPSSRSRSFSPRPLAGDSRRVAAVGIIELVDLLRKVALLLRGGAAGPRLWQQTLLGVESEHLKNVLRRASALAALGLSPETALGLIGSPSRTEKLVREGVSELSMCLRISERSGVPLADLLENLARNLEQRSDLEALRSTALAGPKATMTLLNWLPLLGLGAGYLIGVNPLSALLTSPWGVSSLCIGTVLAIISRVWASSLIRRAERVS